MSDNVQNDAPWIKTTSSSPAAAAAGAATRYCTTPTALHFASAGGSGSVSGSTTTHPDIAYSAARFQAPSIHQQHVNSPTMPTTSLTHLAVSGVPTANTNFAHHHATAAVPHSIASSNVPVYPPTAAATSVLTPNPFAAVSGGAPPTVVAQMSPSTRPFALQQFFHAMNSAAAASLVGNAAVATPLNLNTPSPSQIVIPTGMATSPASNSGLSRSTNIDLPSPSSTSSTGGCAPTGSASGLMSSTTVGAITHTITENVLNAISGVSQNAIPARNMGFGVKSAPDEEKLRRVHQMIEAGVGEQAKQQIVQILDCISTLKPVEKLLLYLRLPGAAPETDPLRQPQNPLGTRSEINHTINWVRSHLEVDPHVSIPKQDVYNDYIAYCERLDIKPLSTADFGKVMKQVFPGIRPRRLGTRGHSRYCYAAMRKTTKLASPQLPPLGSSTSSSTNKSNDASGRGVEDFSSTADPFSVDGTGTETWSTIKTWAEGLLQIKLDDAKDLADRIKSGNMSGAIGNIAAGGTRMSISHKKFGNRETKEKRLMTDMGPLKKRRKKKRKGSSSSESSYNSQPPQKQSSSDKETLQATMTNVGQSTKAPTTQEEESITLIKVKEEVLESPTFQHIQHVTPPNRQKASMGENYLQQQEQQQQIWPMNLAPEQRSVLTRAPATSSSSSAFNVANAARTATAAKNLVPKIIELAAVTTAVEPQATALISTIKEEEVDEYNTSNILCKKVRKAQQTKGFWQQQPTTAATSIVTPALATAPVIPVTTISQAQVIPVITTSAATPTPIEIPQQSVAANTPSPVSNYLMGPPAAASSTSPFAATDSGSVTPTPKVASRNMQQLRAKRLQLAQAAAAAAAAAANEANSTNPADDLPENLGLPRERVISICNMDKHELDDYFINGEEEEDNSNEPDTELLQYFQTGDAEEKLNSLDAGKQRNPTANAASVNNQPPNVAAQLVLAHQAQQPTQATLATVATTTTTITTNTAAHSALSIFTAATTTAAAAMSTTLTPTVGSASASLALMSQKHQQVQQLQQQHQPQSQSQQQQPHVVTSVATKRKLLPPKHCTFAPISPNINGSGTITSVSTAAASNGTLFASPGVTSTRLRPKPALLAKQHSLDIDLSGAIPFPSPSMTTMHDPMIGASRRRRNYVSSATSASAPPSPSILQQQQQQQLFNVQQFQSAANQWLTTTSFLNDQNSLDLDLFGAANGNNAAANTTHYGTGVVAGGALPFDEYATETQRSQSVPLSQLQRIHSPPLGNMSMVGSTTAATGVIKSDFIIGENSLIGSENSSSQHSNPTSATISAAATAAIIKLEDPAAADVMASDSAALLDSVDVNEILSSPDFVQNFTSIAQQQGNSIAAATTTCSSAGSSSGYSSGACTTFTGGGISGNIMSRSVPSTPLPHHHQNLFGQSSVNFYSQRRRSGIITSDELQLSPCSGFVGNTNKYTNNSSNNNNNNSHSSGSVSFSNSFGSRSIYDISKSMPTTPITTPSFRYSPEFNRDFLINGNTIDDSISFGGVGSDSLITAGGPTSVSATGDDDSVNLVSNLNADALLPAEDISVPGADDVLLGNL